MNKTKRCKHDNETDQRVVRSDERWRKVPGEMPTGYIEYFNDKKGDV